MSEHGTAVRYDYHECRCQACRKGNADRNKAQRSVRTDAPKDPNDPRHGSKAFYSNHGCRCEPCKAANAVTLRAEYLTRLASGAKDDPTDRRHGKYTFYTAWGCRCDLCKAASAAYQAIRVSKKRTAS